MNPRLPEGTLRAVEFVAREPSDCGILLDFDGTLAHIVEHPADAVALPGVGDALGRLVDLVKKVALISGRPVVDLRSRIEVDGVEYLGLYGLEHARGRGEIHVDPAARPWAGEVSTIAEAAEVWVLSSGHFLDGVIVEAKGLAVALHYRMASDPVGAAAKIKEWAHAEAVRTGMRLIAGKLNYELVPPLVSDKGLAAVALISECKSCLYVGDDVGDIPAFDALRDWQGRTLLVAVGGAELPPNLGQRADLILPSPDDVAHLLDEIVTRLST